MTREDIVRLWDEANNWGIPIRSGLAKELERFAALVADAEREACAKLCENAAHSESGSELAWASRACAAAIRARGEK